MKRPDSDKWIEAMQCELKSLADNETASYVKYEHPQNIIDSKWVYTIKRHADGSIDRYKARFVCKGFSQKLGVDYEEIFAPVSKHTSFRALCAYAAANSLSIRHMDVNTAFLNSRVNEEMFVKQPEGFVNEGPNGEVLVLKLHKSLYGLKQAPRNWHATVNEFILSLNFQNSDADSCVYVRQDKCIILLYVDDLIIFTPNDQQSDVLAKTFSDRFKMSDLGPISLLSWNRGTAESGARYYIP